MKNFFLFILALASSSLFAQPQGFFLNDHARKDAILPAFNDVLKPQADATVSVRVDAAVKLATVSKYLYGNNVNVYMTQMVNQPALLNHLRELSPNVLRFPGGNLSSVYFWNADKNAPPPNAPVRLIDANGVAQEPGYWYGNNPEEWTLSVDNYYKVLEQTNSTGIITVNYGYARYGTGSNPVSSAAHLAAEWVRYDNGRTKFWEVGNESNGTWQAGYRIAPAANKDGQPEIINGTLYGQHFKVFADSMRKAAAEIGANIYLGAQLLQEEPASWWNATDRNWNTSVLAASENAPDYYVIHSYYTPFQTNSTVEDVLSSAITVTSSMRNVVDKYIGEAGVARKPLALTEWNIFAEGSKQQASSINGIHAVLVLGELIKNNYGLACRWDLANGWNNGNDHGMFSQGDASNDPKWNPRAVYYYMYYFQKYFGDTMVKSTVSGSDDVVSYASRFNDKETSVVLVNRGKSAQVVSLTLDNYGFGDRYYYYTLTPGTDHVSFPLKVLVNGKSGTFAAGGPPNVSSIPAHSSTVGSGIKLSLPARSVTYVLVDHGNRVITSIDDESSVIVQVYPNPVTHSVKVVFPQNTFTTIVLYDAAGEEVLRASLDPSNEQFVMGTTLSSGSYLIRLSGNQKVITKKIIVKR
ncbi:MAG TPA: T9SS type A sorting domain-containing protein [Chryseosolibacter sp.]